MNQFSARLIAVPLLIAGCTGLCDQVCEAQSFQYPPYGAQRGRMVARDGIGHSVRYRWGNGLTPAGAAVISEAITAFAPAVIAIAGRDADFEADARSRDAARSEMRDRLAIAQEQANDLLVRTARLIEPTFAAPSPANGGSGGPATITDPPDPTTDFGTDPWDGVADNAGAQPVPQQPVPQQPVPQQPVPQQPVPQQPVPQQPVPQQPVPQQPVPPADDAGTNALNNG